MKREQVRARAQKGGDGLIAHLVHFIETVDYLLSALAAAEGTPEAVTAHSHALTADAGDATHHFLGQYALQAYPG